MSGKTRKNKSGKERLKRQNAGATGASRFRAAWKDQRRRPWLIFLAALCVVILGIAIYGITTIVSRAIALPTISKVTTSNIPKTHNISPLVISDTAVSNMTESGAIITWVTNRLATSQLEYWISDSVDHSIVSADFLSTHHSFVLDMLKTDVTYNYRVKSVDTVNSMTAEMESKFIFPKLLKTGDRAPDFTLTSLDGKAITLSDYRGKLVILYFWAWSCLPCKTKLYTIQETIAKMPADKVVVLGIHAEGEASIIRNFVIKNRLTLPVLLDPDEAVRQWYRVISNNAVFFIDRDGIIRMINAKFDNVEELRDIINTMLVAN